MTSITLNWHECEMAVQVGVRRQLSSLSKNSRPGEGYEGSGWDIHIQGALGEMAVAKALNVYWSGSVNTFAACDLPGLQVRTRSRHWYDLIVRSRDSDDEPFILVTGECPTFTVHGWIYGRDAKKPKWLREYGNRPAAYFVPQGALRPLKALNKRVS